MSTYENYGGGDTAKIINKLLSYSGAKICSSIVVRNQFNKNPMDDVRIMQKVDKKVNTFYRDIVERHRLLFSTLNDALLFTLNDATAA